MEKLVMVEKECCCCRRLEVPLLRQAIKILFQVLNMKSDLYSILTTNYL